MDSNLSDTIILPFITTINQEIISSGIGNSNSIYKYSNFKKQLENMFGNFVLNCCIDDNDDLLLLNIRELIKNIGSDNKYYNLLKITPNFIIDKETMKIICIFNHPNKLNSDAVKELKNINWSNIVVRPIYLGIEIIVFNHKNNWYITSDLSLTSMTNLFLEIMHDVTKLNINMCHYFVLTHNKVKKLINNGICFNSDGYKKEIIHKKSTTKYLYMDNLYVINDIEKISKLYFSCIDELLAKMELISIENKINKKISLAGYDISVDGLTTYRLYTEIYISLMRDIPEFDNINQLYLELYQTNKLNEVLPFLSNYPTEIIHRINMTMKTLSKELLNIYHITRKQKNTEIYKLLTDTYRKILYGIHGIYIENRKIDFINGIEKDENDSKSISVHDIYYYIKSIPFQQLKQLFIDRQKLLSNESVSIHLIKNCIFILTQTNLMFD
jgi:hypothetical protein